MKTKLLLSAFLLFSVTMSYGQWIYTNLSEAKCQMGSTALNNKAYFAGGNDNNDIAQTEVEIYNIDTEDWDSTINLSQARLYPSCVTAGSKVFFAGGIDFSTMACFDNVDIWNTITKEWTHDYLSVARFSSSGVSKGNKVLFAGGANLAAGLSYTMVDIYDTTTHSWSEANLTAPRAAMASAVAGDHAFFAGGVNVQTGQVSDIVDIYRFSTNTWSTATLSEARAFLAAAAVGRKILIAGGTNSANQPSDRVDIYDTVTGIWTTATLSEARSFLQVNAAIVCGNAYFVGGGVLDLNTFNWTSASSTIDIYNWMDSTWTTDNLTQPIFNHEIAGVKDHLVVAGGVMFAPNPVVVSTVEIFIDPDCVFPGISALPAQSVKIEVYPNPGSGKIHLQIPSDDLQMPMMINIFNMQGQMVFNTYLADYDSDLNLQLPAGVYILKVITDDNVYSKVITIQ
jgi:hypothetical protein